MGLTAGDRWLERSTRRYRRRAGRRKSRSFLLPLLAIGVAIAKPVAAQTASGGAGGTIEREQRPPTQPLAERPAIRIERPRAGVSPATTMRFIVRTVVVEGVTRLKPAVVEAITGSLKGREIALADLAAAADALTRVYADAGYALSFALVPEQDVVDGVVRIVVVEGVIGEVDVEVTGRGALRGQERITSIVRSRAAALQTGEPLRTADLERVLLLLQDMPGVTASAVLQPSPTTDRATRLVVRLNVDPVEGGLSFDNRLRSDFGRYQYGADLSLNSTLLFGDQFSFGTRRGVEGDAFTYDFARYQAPLGALTLTGSYARADTKASDGLLATLDFEGDERVGRVGFSYPVIRSRARNLVLGLAAEATNARSSILGTTLVRDKIRTLTADAAFDWVADNGAIALVGASLTQGINGLGATDADNDFASRPGGTPDFTAVGARISYSLPVRGFSVRVEGDGQLVVAGQALAPVECTYGGQRLGRGYDPGVIGGDHCLRAGLEVARAVRIIDGLALEPFAYTDAALVRQKGVLAAGDDREATAASAGLGVRAATRFGLSAEGLVAVPLTRSIAPDGRDPRFFFTLAYRW